MTRHITIVGRGIVGLCSAWYCRQRGMQVTVIDRQPAEYEGCSFGNAGMVVPSHFVPLAAPGMVALGLKWMWNPSSPFYIQPRLSPELLSWCWKFWRSATREHVQRAGRLLRDLQLASRQLYVQLAQEFGDEFALRQNGLLMLCKTAKAWEEEAHTAEQGRALGIPAEVLDARQTAALEPDVALDIHGSVFFPQDCHLSPRILMHGLRRRLEQAGVEFCDQAEILDIDKGSDRVECLQTSLGERAFDQLLLAGGIWTSRLAKTLGLSIPMQAGKGYSLTLAAPPRRPRICSILTEARVATTPMGNSFRVGGTMEIAGINERISPRRVDGIINAVCRYYPDFRPAHFAGISPWAGLRPCSPDGLPYLGRSRRFKNLFIATGHAMLGISLGPITGKLMSQLLSEEQPEIALDLVRPERFET